MIQLPPKELVYELCEIAAKLEILEGQRARETISDATAQEQIDRILSEVPQNMLAEIGTVRSLMTAHRLLQGDLFRDRWKTGRNDIPATLIARKRERETLWELLWSQPLYSLTYYATVEATDERAVWNIPLHIKVVLQWMGYAQVLQHGWLGDPVQYIRTTEARVQNLEHRIAFTAKSARGQLLSGLRAELAGQQAILKMFKPALLGTRGAAAASSSSAIRGLMVRSIDRLVPAFSTERYSIISALLGLVDVAVTPQTVRTILTASRRSGAAAK